MERRRLFGDLPKGEKPPKFVEAMERINHASEVELEMLNASLT